MIKFWVGFFVFTCMGQGLLADTHLMVFGGGGVPVDGAERLVGLAGGTQARILFIPWSASKPEEDLEYFHSVIDPVAPVEIVMAESGPTVKAHLDTFIESLPSFSAIYFVGGNQNLVMDICEESPSLLKAFTSAFEKGTVFSGSSAGLAVMSSTMLTGEADLTELDPAAVKTRAGLGLLKNVVLDQHFIRRNRMQRLLSVMLGSTERYAIGVDENTGLYVHNGYEFEVLGGRKAVLIDTGEIPGKITLEIKRPGDRFQLNSTPVQRTANR